MKILFFSSPIGLGHVSRDLAVAIELRRRGVKVVFSTGGLAVRLVKAYGFKVFKLNEVPRFRIVNGALRGLLTWFFLYLTYLLRGLRRCLDAIRLVKPDLIVVDEEYSALLTLALLRRKCVFITDVPELPLTGFYRFFSVPVNLALKTLLKFTCKMVVVPEKGVSSGFIRYVGPISRPFTVDREETRRKLGVEKWLVTVLSSGWGLGEFLLKEVVRVARKLKGVKVVVVGPVKHRYKEVLNLGFIPDAQNLVLASDLVICLAGKGAIDEARVAGTPFIAIPVKGHPEQERNASLHGFKHEDLKRLGELIPKLLGKRRKPEKNGVYELVNLLETLLVK